MKNCLYLLLLLIFTSSCVSRIDKHGYMIDLSDLEMLQEGVSSKENVLRVMGSPSVVSSLDAGETWIYYSEEVKNVLFFLPDVVDRTIVSISFNDENIMSELQKVTLSQESVGMNFVSDYTNVNSHQSSTLKSFISNVGQVRPQ